MSDLTADELKKLAGLCNIEIWWSDLESRFLYDQPLGPEIWIPEHNVEQAFMVLDVFDYYELGKDMSSAAPYFCHIFETIGGPLLSQAIGMNLEWAICSAALAVGEKA